MNLSARQHYNIKLKCLSLIGDRELYLFIFILGDLESPALDMWAYVDECISTPFYLSILDDSY